MALSRDDLIKMASGTRVDVPPEVYGPHEPSEAWPDHPNIRRALQWFTDAVGDEWHQRRDQAFAKLYGSAVGVMENSGKGHFFDTSDVLGWYLFLVDAFLDHRWNYEPMYGSRVIPIFDAIGRNLDGLVGIPGIDERLERLVRAERKQPNGGLFEFLVSCAYLREGFDVCFRPERPGQQKSHDLDVQRHGLKYAVECKRMETSDYGDKERSRMRELWRPASSAVQSMERSTFCDVRFTVPVFDVPDDYLMEKLTAWLRSGRASFLWNDAISSGVVGDLDLEPLQNALMTEDVLAAGTRMQELLTGSYQAHENLIQSMRSKTDTSPRYVTACDVAIVLRWKSLAPFAVSAKARDVVRKLAEATAQLPTDIPGIVHVGFEAVEGKEAEEARFEKIVASTKKFDPRGKPLNFVYCHYFLPESPPEIAWVFDEKVSWQRISGAARRPLLSPMLVVPEHE